MGEKTEGASGDPQEDLSAPESWEAADVEESMKRLMLSSPSGISLNSAAKKISVASSSSIYGGNSPDEEVEFDGPGLSAANLNSSSTGLPEKARGLSEDAINQVDQFLREALQNPRERLSILRMEQDVEKFIRDPTQQQLEFQQLPTSYLRLAAHRVAQHYFLQSMVLQDSSLPEVPGTRIIVRKTSSECQIPRIRLADIPVSIPQEDTGTVKLAIKQRPQKHLSGAYNSGSSSADSNQAKSVEERKEEYNKARARIFNSNNHGGASGSKQESLMKSPDSFCQGSVGSPKFDDKPVPLTPSLSIGRFATDSFAGSSSRPSRSRIEREPIGRYRPNNRVAIFRDRDIDRKDPDYDRSYDRYMQRFDPGFGFNNGPYAIQPLYAPVVNYNTEFPQLASPSHRPQAPADPQPRPIPQHLPGHWVPPSNTAGVGYIHPETLMSPYSPNHVSAGARPSSTIYLQPSQYPCQRPGMQLIHPSEQFHQLYSQPLQQQHNATTLALARPR